MSAKSKNKKSSGLTKQSKLTLLSVLAGAIVLVGGVGAYLKFSTVPPPDLADAQVDEVVEFLGTANGYARMPINQREQYVNEAYQKFASYEDRVAMHRGFRQMTDREREVFLNASFEVVKERFLEQAREYNTLGRAGKARFVDNAIRNLEGVQAQIIGGGGAPIGPNGERVDLGDPFMGHTPRTVEEGYSRVWDMTTPKERDEGRELADSMAARMKQLDENPSERERFRRAGN